MRVFVDRRFSSRISVFCSVSDPSPMQRRKTFCELFGTDGAHRHNFAMIVDTQVLCASPTSVM